MQSDKADVVRAKATSRRSFTRRSFTSTKATTCGILRDGTGTAASELAATEAGVVREKATSRRSFTRRSFTSTAPSTSELHASTPSPEEAKAKTLRPQFRKLCITKIVVDVLKT